MKIGRERDAFVVVITFGSTTLHRLQPVLGVKRTNCECVQRARLSQSLHLLFIASVVVVVVVVFHATEHVSKPVGLQLFFFYSVFLAFGSTQKSCAWKEFTTSQQRFKQKFITE
jgi:FtsH-binding integral membrane protein